MKNTDKVTMTIGQLKTLIKEAKKQHRALLKESTRFDQEDSIPKLDDIYVNMKNEFDNTLSTDNFIRCHITKRGDSIYCSFDLEKPDDFNETSEEDEEWWEDKTNSTNLMYDYFVEHLKDSFGDIFSYYDNCILMDEINGPKNAKFFIDCERNDDGILTTIIKQK